MKNKDFYTPWGEEYQMNASGFFCGFNMPEALKSDENDSAHKLPPYAKRKSFLVDDYMACPQKWMRCKGKVSSYFVPIQEGKGMWLDFNKNLEHTHDVAIVVSVQGVNAITGLPCSDPHLEQYVEKCPKHDKHFGHNRYCEECGYEWPKQNYISTTGTPGSSLWIDGFRAASGAVQQYILTAKESRGVASHIIGDDRVFAIGVSFFISKKKKDIPYRLGGVLRSSPIKGGDILFGSIKKKSNSHRKQVGGSSLLSPLHTTVYSQISCHARGKIMASSASSEVADPAVQDAIQHLSETTNDPKPQFFSPIHTPIDWKVPCEDGNWRSLSLIKNGSEAQDAIKIMSEADNDPNPITTTHHAMSVMESVETKNMEVGAGACIGQEIYDDPESLDFWKEDPEAILCINYCLEEECMEILKQGKKNKHNKAKGFLEEIPVGN